MRALVASLESALAFTQALAGAVPVLTQLLASATLSDVHDAIALLISYAKFGVAGAPAALRKMLPLVFSREQGALKHPIQTPWYRQARTGGGCVQLSGWRKGVATAGGEKRCKTLPTTVHWGKVHAHHMHTGRHASDQAQAGVQQLTWTPLICKTMAFVLWMLHGPLPFQREEHPYL